METICKPIRLRQRPTIHVLSTRKGFCYKANLLEQIMCFVTLLILLYLQIVTRNPELQSITVIKIRLGLTNIELALTSFIVLVIVR